MGSLKYPNSTFDMNQMIGDYTMKQWNNMDPAAAVTNGGNYMNGLAGTQVNGKPAVNNGLLGSLYKDSAGNMSGSKMLGSAGSVVGLASSLMDMFGGNPELDEQKKVNAANIKNMERLAGNAETAYDNQRARGTASRARANGGVDPLKTVSKPNSQPRLA